MSKKWSFLLPAAAVAGVLLVLTGTALRAGATLKAGEPTVIPQQQDGSFLLVSQGTCSPAQEEEQGWAEFGGGPGEDCCARHLEFCVENICMCGFSGFSCWTNSNGGCSSLCYCSWCDP